MNSEKHFHEYVVAKYSAEIRPIMNRFFADLKFYFLGRQNLRILASPC